jgi:hypothetical protein
VGQQQHHETNTDGARKKRGSLPIQPQFISSREISGFLLFLDGYDRLALIRFLSSVASMEMNLPDDSSSSTRELFFLNLLAQMLHLLLSFFLQETKKKVNFDTPVGC